MPTSTARHTRTAQRTKRRRCSETLRREITDLEEELATPAAKKPASSEKATGAHVLTEDEKHTKLAALRRQDDNMAAEIDSLAPTRVRTVRTATSVASSTI